MPDYSMRRHCRSSAEQPGSGRHSYARRDSQEGFDAEWRLVGLFTFERDLINRCELYDEADLDTALGRFDELSQPAFKPQNMASQVYERFWNSFAARDWVTMAEIMAVDTTFDDRRRRGERRDPSRTGGRAGGHASHRRTLD